MKMIQEGPELAVAKVAVALTAQLASQADSPFFLRDTSSPTTSPPSFPPVPCDTRG